MSLVALRPAPALVEVGDRGPTGVDGAEAAVRVQTLPRIMNFAVPAPSTHRCWAAGSSHTVLSLVAR